MPYGDDDTCAVMVGCGTSVMSTEYGDGTSVVASFTNARHMYVLLHVNAAGVHAVFAWYPEFTQFTGFCAESRSQISNLNCNDELGGASMSRARAHSCGVRVGAWYPFGGYSSWRTG